MKTGIHQLTMQEYLQLPALSSGVAHKCLSANPFEAWFDSPWNPERVDKPNDASDAGTCSHAVLLEGSHAKICVIKPEDYPSKPTKANPEGNVPTGWTNDAIRGARDAARSNGLIPVLPWDMVEVNAMVGVAQKYVADSDIAGIFEDGKSEQTIIWQEGDVWCKARPDWLGERFMLHFKTTKNSVNPWAFSRLAANSGYDFAMMFYLRGLNAVLPDNECAHYILAQSQNAPYSCKLFDLTTRRADVIESQVERAINAWALCQAAGVWPRYNGSAHSIDLAAWEMERALEAGDIEGLGYAEDISGQGVQA